LDLCSLTLKDLDDVAKSFMKVLSGFFHEREEYPDVKIKQNADEGIKLTETVETKDIFEEKEVVPVNGQDLQLKDRRVANGSIN
jgi:cyclic-di-AMP phosphodiesterase PgpH